jgi:hypothetical protein
MENIHECIYVLYFEHVPRVKRTEKSFLFMVSQSIPMLGSVLRQLQPFPLSIHCNPKLVQGTAPSFLIPLDGIHGDGARVFFGELVDPLEFLGGDVHDHLRSS